MRSHWIYKPYFRPGPQIFIKSTVANEPGQTTLVETVDSYLQSMLDSTLGDIADYMNPDFTTGLTARTEQAIIDNYVLTAQEHVEAFPTTGINVDPVVLGTYYGQLQVARMKQILGWKKMQKSVWEVWVAMPGPIH